MIVNVGEQTADTNYKESIQTMMTNATEKPKIWVDFHNCDIQGRIRLNTVGTIESLNELGLVISSDLIATFYCFEREQDGEIVYSQEEQLWVARLTGEARDLNND